jgi:hypothetical protein
VGDTRIGDTITLDKVPASEPLPGFKEVKPVVFSSLYPVASDDYPGLVDALEKYTLNDAALVYEKDSSAALGMGFRSRQDSNCPDQQADHASKVGQLSLHGMHSLHGSHGFSACGRNRFRSSRSVTACDREAGLWRSEVTGSRAIDARKKRLMRRLRWKPRAEAARSQHV